MATAAARAGPPVPQAVYTAPPVPQAVYTAPPVPEAVYTAPPVLQAVNSNVFPAQFYVEAAQRSVQEEVDFIIQESSLLQARPSYQSPPPLLAYPPIQAETKSLFKQPTCALPEVNIC